MKLYKYLRPELDQSGELIFRSPIAETLWERGEMSRYSNPASGGIYACESPKHHALRDYADQGILVTLEGWGDCPVSDNGAYIVEYARIVDYDPGEAYAYILEKGGCPLYIPADAEVLIERRQPDLIRRWRGQRAVTTALQDGGSDYLRSLACGDPDMAVLYAYLIDSGPHTETRVAACDKPKTALVYADLVDGGYHPLTHLAILGTGTGVVLTTAYQHAVNPVSDYVRYEHTKHREVLDIPKSLALQITVRLATRREDGWLWLDWGQSHRLYDDNYIRPDIGLDLHRGAPLAYDIKNDDSVMCRAEIWGTLMLDTLYRGHTLRYIAPYIRIISIDVGGL